MDVPALRGRSESAQKMRRSLARGQSFVPCPERPAGNTTVVLLARAEDDPRAERERAASTYHTHSTMRIAQGAREVSQEGCFAAAICTEGGSGSVFRFTRLDKTALTTLEASNRSAGGVEEGWGRWMRLVRADLAHQPRPRDDTTDRGSFCEGSSASCK